MPVRVDEGHVIKDEGLLIADDLAPAMGASSHREWIHAVRNQSRLARLVMKAKVIPDNSLGDPVSAVVEHGRWIAHCECGGTENVTPNDKVFFCFSCMNAANRFHLRPVSFPDSLTQRSIETVLIQRLHHRDMNWKVGEPIINLEEENRRLAIEGKLR